MAGEPATYVMCLYQLAASVMTCASWLTFALMTGITLAIEVLAMWKLRTLPSRSTSDMTTFLCCEAGNFWRPFGWVVALTVDRPCDLLKLGIHDVLHLLGRPSAVALEFNDQHAHGRRLTRRTSEQQAASLLGFALS